MEIRTVEISYPHFKPGEQFLNVHSGCVWVCHHTEPPKEGQAARVYYGTGEGDWCAAAGCVPVSNQPITDAERFAAMREETGFLGLIRLPSGVWQVYTAYAHLSMQFEHKTPAGALDEWVMKLRSRAAKDGVNRPRKERAGD